MSNSTDRRNGARQRSSGIGGRQSSAGTGTCGDMSRGHTGIGAGRQDGAGRRRGSAHSRGRKAKGNAVSRIGNGRFDSWHTEHILQFKLGIRQLATMETILNDHVDSTDAELKGETNLYRRDQ